MSQQFNSFKVLLALIFMLLAFLFAYFAIRALFDFLPDQIASRKDLFLEGIRNTLKLSLFASFFGFFYGIILVWIKVFGGRFFGFFADALILIFQGTPLLVQIFFVFYGLPLLFEWIGLSLQVSDFWSACIALSLNVGVYHAEAMRGALLAIDPGQERVARMLGFSKWGIYREVLLPQSLQNALFPLLSNTAALLKDSALASSIGVLELSMAGSRFASETFRPIPSLATVAAVYLVFTMVLFLWKWFYAPLGRRGNYSV